LSRLPLGQADLKNQWDCGSLISVPVAIALAIKVLRKLSACSFDVVKYNPCPKSFLFAHLI